MDRILILMSANDYADAEVALKTALENARRPEQLSFGLCLLGEPDETEDAAMRLMPNLRFLCPADDAWGAMPQLWQGEGYVLMGHPAMRFERGWDKGLLQAMHICRKQTQQALAAKEEDPQLQQDIAFGCVLTGYLPSRDDKMKAVYPVAADELSLDGTLTFRHGTPLRYSAAPVRSPFLHPDFCFGPAGFFRAMAADNGNEPLFLRAFRDGWMLNTLNKAHIRLLWDLEIPACAVPPLGEMHDEFLAETGISFAEGLLSPQSRRGTTQQKMELCSQVPTRVRAREMLRRMQQDGKARLASLARKPKKEILPKCVTACGADVTEDELLWLSQLARLQRLPLMGYADPLALRRVAEFLPDVLESKPRHTISLPEGAPTPPPALSKAALLASARDRYLTPSHYVWIDPDCVQYPVYEKTAFDWEKLCTDQIEIATVGGVPDTSMFVVPESRVLTLAREIEGRCAALYQQRRELPDEAELWKLIIRSNPEWFHLNPLPVKRQLFTLLTP